MRRDAFSCLETLKHMPPLHHKLPNEQYDFFKSEAMKWLLSQPKVQASLITQMNKHCVYDKDTGTWVGKEYKPTTER